MDNEFPSDQAPATRAIMRAGGEVVRLTDLPTPCLILDAVRLRQNATMMDCRARDLGVALRPNVKTHKCVEVGQVQLGDRPKAATVSTLAEARAFAAGAFLDLTYAVPIEPGKFDAAIEVSRACERLALITDDPEVPAALNHEARRAGVTLDVFLEVDSGQHRTGVDPQSDLACQIPRRIVDCSHLCFAGILTHAGQSYQTASRADQLAVARHERDVMVDLAGRLRSAGIAVPVVSVGSIPGVMAVDHLDGVTEIRPGNYIFFDAFQTTIGSCAFEDCALTVLAAIIHRDTRTRKVVIDAGAIALSKDRGAIDVDPDAGYGRALRLDGTDLGSRVQAMSQEHGSFVVHDEALFRELRVGTRVRVLPNHSCLTAAQYPHYHVLDRDQVVDRWPIHRGW